MNAIWCIKQSMELCISPADISCNKHVSTIKTVTKNSQRSTTSLMTVSPLLQNE